MAYGENPYEPVGLRPDPTPAPPAPRLWAVGLTDMIVHEFDALAGGQRNIIRDRFGFNRIAEVLVRPELALGVLLAIQQEKFLWLCRKVQELEKSGRS